MAYFFFLDLHPFVKRSSDLKIEGGWLAEEMIV